MRERQSIQNQAMLWSEVIKLCCGVLSYRAKRDIACPMRPCAGRFRSKGREVDYTLRGGDPCWDWRWLRCGRDWACVKPTRIMISVQYSLQESGVRPGTQAAVCVTRFYRL